jgi:hypothetical protein
MEVPMSKALTPQIPVTEWLALRKGAATKIDPETAEVMWAYGYTLDPYGVCADLPDELKQSGREYSTRSPGSEIGVHFGDLPDEVHKRLWMDHWKKLPFPAGLDDALEEVMRLKSEQGV